MAGGRRCLGSSACHLGVSSASSGRHLDSSWLILASSWLILASSRRHLGSSWLIFAHLGVILAHLGSSWRILAHLGKSWRHLGSPCRHLGVQRALGGVIFEPQVDPQIPAQQSIKATKDRTFLGISFTHFVHAILFVQCPYAHRKRKWARLGYRVAYFQKSFFRSPVAVICQKRLLFLKT